MELNENLPQNEETKATATTQEEEINLYWSEDNPGALDIYSYPQLLSIKDYMKIALIYPFFIQIVLALLVIFTFGVTSSMVLYGILYYIVMLLPFIGLMQMVNHSLIYRKPNAPFLVKSAFWMSMLFWLIMFVSLLMQGQSGVVLALLLSVIYGYMGLKECGAGELDDVFPTEYRKVSITDFLLVFSFFATPFILYAVYLAVMDYFGIVF